MPSTDDRGTSFRPILAYRVSMAPASACPTHELVQSWSRMPGTNASSVVSTGNDRRAPNNARAL